MKWWRKGYVYILRWWCKKRKQEWCDIEEEKREVNEWMIVGKSNKSHAICSFWEGEDFFDRGISR
jgi:hypothetical protein